MLVSRGLRLLRQLLKRSSISRIAAVAFGVAIASLGWTWQSLTDDPNEIHPLDGICVSVTPNYEEGYTSGGIRYKIIHNEGEQYSNRYIGMAPGRDRVRIEFDPPVAAVGASCITSGLSPSFEDPQQRLTAEPTLFFAQSGYLGIAGNEPISEVTLATESGPLVIDSIDIRPFPKAQADSVTCYKNSKVLPDAGSVLGNDAYSEEAVLCSPPLHAKHFELHPDGSLVYEPEPGFVGIDSFLYCSTNNGGAARSEVVTATVQVLPRNFPPSFRSAGDVVVPAGSGPCTIEQWASEMDAGGPDEAGQNLTWQVETDRPDLFLVQPALDGAGTLIFAPSSNSIGEAEVHVRLMDDGGRLNGGMDCSDDHSFRILFEIPESAPTLPALPDILVDPTAGVSVSAAAVDHNFPVFYTLEKGPVGALVDPKIGLVTWNPDAHIAPGTYEFSLIATETGPQRLSRRVQFRAEIPEPTLAMKLFQVSRSLALRKARTSGTAAMRFQSPASGSH